tara:strand:+ start:70 stop:492 length:423 start_codon:yes stop_codon:yes gene_type:complete
MADTSKADTKGINIQLDKTFKDGLKIGKKSYLKDWNVGFDSFFGETKESGTYNTNPDTTQEGSLSIGATTKKGTKLGITHSRTKAKENKYYPERKTSSTIFSISKSFNKGGKVKKAYNGSFIAGGPGSNATYRKYYKGMI